MGADADGMGHVGTVFPRDLGVDQGACVRGLTAAWLLNAPERIFAGRKGQEARPLDRLLQDLVMAGSQFSPHQVAVLVDLSRPLEGVLAAGAFCQAIGVRLAVSLPLEDNALVRAGLTSCPPFGEIAGCTLVLAVGDPFSSHPAVADAVRDMQFGGRGNKLIALDTAWGRTSREADEAVTVSPVKLAAFMAALAVECGAGEVSAALGAAGTDGICVAAGIPAAQVKRLAAQLKGAKSVGILLGHPLGRYSSGAAVAAAAAQAAAALKAKVWPLLVSTNSAALPRLKQQYRAVELGGLLSDAAAGRLKALLVVGVDPASLLPEELWKRLAQACELVCWAGSLESPFAAEAEFVVPLALPWEEEGTVLAPSGKPARFIPWLPKPATTVTVKELMARLGALAGVWAALPIDPAQLMAGAPTAAAVGDLVSPEAISGAAEPAAGQAFVVGAPEPQGYTGGISLSAAIWQRRLAVEEKASASPEVAAEIGLMAKGPVELKDGTEATVLCTPAQSGEGRAVALPSHWPLLRELLKWREADGRVEPAPAAVRVRKV